MISHQRNILETIEEKPIQIQLRNETHVEPTTQTLLNKIRW